MTEEIEKPIPWWKVKKPTTRPSSHSPKKVGFGCTTVPWRQQKPYGRAWWK